MILNAGQISRALPVSKPAAGSAPKAAGLRASSLAYASRNRVSMRTLPVAVAAPENQIRKRLKINNRNCLTLFRTGHAAEFRRHTCSCIEINLLIFNEIYL